MFEYRLEHVMSYTAKVRDELEIIGQLPEGLRANGYIIDGFVWHAPTQFPHRNSHCSTTSGGPGVTCLVF
jgi:hypothetical protein